MDVSRDAMIAADEVSHWDALHDGWDVDRINHGEMYSDHRNFDISTQTKLLGLHDLRFIGPYGTQILALLSG